MNSNLNHETLYGVGLLDDLHNYFPALLYDSSSFESVQDVLGYIHRQTRNRFDLFSYGLREYQSTHPQQPVENSYRRVVRTSLGGMTSQGLPAHSTLRRSTMPVPTTNATDTTVLPHPSSFNTNIPNLNTIQVELNHFVQRVEEDEEEEGEEVVGQQTNTLLANALLTLLQLPIQQTYGRPVNQLLLRPTTMDQFLAPVVVRPTVEQIAANTSLGSLVSDTEHDCAICQDTLTSEQEGRKLNACGHWFHRSCIDTWLQGNVHCPVCRHDIREPAATEEEQ